MAVLFLVAESIPGRSSAQSSLQAPPNLPDDEPLGALITWLQDDHEVERPKEDRFDHDLVAQRIARRLSSPHHEAPTIAVIGPLGSGKSTIRRLVGHHLKGIRRARLVELSLWPFDSAEAAVVGILRALVRTLSSRVNTLSIAGLPDEYATTIEKVGGRWGPLARLLRTDFRPDTILARLSRICRAIDTRIILWIEDLERFSGTERLHGEQALLREAERLGPVRALLYLLDRSESVSVVVADTSLETRYDIGKIARFVERPPKVNPDNLWKHTAVLRSACLNGYPRKIIDPADSEHRQQLTPPADEYSLHVWLWKLHYDEPRVQEALALLLDTPRGFKWALRLTLETWQRLAGEIDFDDVLLASALRVARPDVFALVEEHIDVFRNGFRKSDLGPQGHPEEHPVRQELEALLGREANERMRNAVKALLSFVFPALQPGAASNIYVARPQGLAVVRHADYWCRYLTLPDIPESESDQQALESIRAWNAGEPSDVVRRLVDSGRAGQIETFVSRFRRRDLCRLLREVTTTVSDQSAKEWGGGIDVPGITSVWRMMQERRPPEQELVDTTKDLISDLIPVHLPLAHNIEYYFAATNGSVPPLVSQTNSEDIRRLAQRTLCESFRPGMACALLEATRDGSPYVLTGICWGPRRLPTNEPPFDGWETISRVLLEAAELDLGKGLPLIVPFVAKGEMQTPRVVDDDGILRDERRFVAEFNEEAARQLFDFDRLVRLFAPAELPSDLEPQLAALFEAVCDAARRHCAGPPSSK